MKYTIKKISEKLDYNTNEPKKDKYGNQQYVVTVADEAGTETTFTKSWKSPKAVGDILVGNLEQSEYNGTTYWKFTEEKQGGAGYGGNGGRYQENPEKQASIERQNSLTNAISYCTTKAQVLLAMKKPEEALKEMEGKHVLQVATYFAKYNNGGVNVVMTADEVAQAFGYEAKKEEPSEPPKSDKPWENDPKYSMPQDDEYLSE